MLIGAMNHPNLDILQELKWMAEMKLEFVDLTLEPPRASSWLVNPKEIRAALNSYGMTAIGHTAYYLPLACPFEEIRQAAIIEMRRCIEAFSRIGVKWMNIHPDRNVPLHTRDFIIERNLQTLSELLPFARDHGMGLMLENLPGEYNTVPQLASLLNPFPELGLHLDIGHANLMVERNTTDDIIKAFGNRIQHVHIHDNKGGSADLHLPLGAGNIDYLKYLKLLKNAGYDGTITLEVFSPDRHYLQYSRDLLRKAWDGL